MPIAVGPDDFDGGTLHCPEGLNPVSGGYEFPAFGAVFVDRRDGDGWRVFAQNFSTTTPGTLTIFVYCSPDAVYLDPATRQLEPSTEGARITP